MADAKSAFAVATETAFSATRLGEQDFGSYTVIKDMSVVRALEMFDLAKSF